MRPKGPFIFMVSPSNHMRVIYSVATRLNGGGIGTTSYKAVEGIYRAGCLQKVFCASAEPSSLPNDLVFSTHTSILERLKFLPSRHQWFLKDLIHDLIVASMLHSNEAKLLDIFHVWNGHGLYSLRRAKKFGAKIVVERASSHPLTYERIINEELRKRGLRPQSLVGLNKKRLMAELSEADFITVPSDFAHQSMIENGAPETKLIKIPFGVDLDYFKPSEKSHDGFNVLFVGQVGFRKGVLYLLEAWKKLGLKGAKLRILGQEDAEIKPFLLPYRGDPSIEFLGYGNSLELYQQSDVFVLPSLEEGSALVTYEALACGLPVITTYESGSVIEEGREGFLVPAANAGVLIDRIKFLYDNQSRVSEMAQKATARVKHFSWSEYSRELLEFYKKII